MIGKNCDWSVDFECNSGDFMIQIPIDFMTQVKLFEIKHAKNILPKPGVDKI